MPRSPLHDRHLRLGARFTQFGDWEMPVQYGGVLAEHAAVRNGSGVFDVTHLGRFLLAGDGATGVVQHELCNDIAKVDPGRAQYTMALNESGGIEDDIIVWRLGVESYWVLPNGANYEAIMRRFRRAGDGLQIEGMRHQTVMLAIQGPGAPEAIIDVLGAAPKRFRVTTGEFEREPYWAAGTGYTGERGAEIAVPNHTAPALFDALLDAGVTPCGLGARDTLRLEMGFPLWGQDLDSETTPLEADLEWVVDWEHRFVGSEALERQRGETPAKRLVAFATTGRAIPRHGYPLRSSGSAGVVSSGNYSPVLGHGIGIGYLAPPSDADSAEVEIRGEWVAAEVRSLPFLER